MVIIWGYAFDEPNYKKNINYRIGSYGHMFSRLKDVKTIENIDLLFLGSSHAYRGFDTRIFEKEGYSSFNLGSSNQSHIQTNYLFHRYLPKLNPKLVIYEVYPNSLEVDGVESAIDIIANEDLDFNLFKMALKINHIKVYNTYIFSLFEQLIGKKQNYKEDIVKNDDIYIKKGGFVQKKIKKIQPKNQSPKAWNINPTQLLFFRKNIAFLKRNNIPYILIETPITEKEYNSYTNHSELKNIFENLGEYYNYNLLSELSDEQHFYDLEHLNQDGVLMFNYDLLGIIDDKFSTKDSIQ